MAGLNTAGFGADRLLPQGAGERTAASLDGGLLNSQDLGDYRMLFSKPSFNLSY